MKRLFVYDTKKNTLHFTSLSILSSILPFDFFGASSGLSPLCHTSPCIFYKSSNFKVRSPLQSLNASSKVCISSPTSHIISVVSLMLKLGNFFSKVLISPLFKHPSQHKYLRLVKDFNSRNLESLILEVWAILSVTKFSLAYSKMLSRDFPVIPVSLKSRFLSFLSLKLILN